ncbi:MAG: YceD family protein [Anaerolineae bacterium]
MPTDFKIYIDRLKDGRSEKIEEQASSDFLDVQEEELSFPETVSIKAEAYLTDDHLIIHLSAKTLAKMPCSICNESILVPIHLSDFYHAEPLNELKSPIFDFTSLLREALLLQLPSFIECRGGKCPERETINKFLKDKDQPIQDLPPHPTYFPFADLD